MTDNIVGDGIALVKINNYDDLMECIDMMKADDFNHIAKHPSIFEPEDIENYYKKCYDQHNNIYLIHTDQFIIGNVVLRKVDNQLYFKILINSKHLRRGYGTKVFKAIEKYTDAKELFCFCKIVDLEKKIDFEFDKAGHEFLKKQGFENITWCVTGETSVVYRKKLN